MNRYIPNLHYYHYYHAFNNMLLQTVRVIGIRPYSNRKQVLKFFWESTLEAQETCIFTQNIWKRGLRIHMHKSKSYMFVNVSVVTFCQDSVNGMWEVEGVAALQNSLKIPLFEHCLQPAVWDAPHLQTQQHSITLY